jgi:iron complex outermembrane recepter protein
VDNGDFKIMARLTGVDAQHDPYTENLSAKPTATDQLDRQDYQMVRGQLAIDFSPQARLLLAAYASWNKGVAATATAWWQTPARFTAPPLGIPAGSPCDFSTAAKFDPRRVCHDTPDTGRNETQLYSATFDYDLPFATFTSVTAYGNSDVSQVSDGDGSDLPLAVGSRWIMNAKQFSQEFRLASGDQNALRWLVGGIYFSGKNFEGFGYQDLGYNDLGPTAPFDQFNFFSHGTSKTESWAPFAQFDYDLSKTSVGVPLTLTLGLRYTHDKKYGFNSLDYQLPQVCGGSCGITAGPFSKTWSQTTGKVGASYQVDEKNMLFASVSSGYLAGGNIIGLANIYDPETLVSVDAGWKSRFLDDRLQLNIAAYHEEIKHLQVFIQSSTQSGINNVNGTTKVNGLEVEFTALQLRGQPAQRDAALRLQPGRGVPLRNRLRRDHAADRHLRLGQGGLPAGQLRHLAAEGLPHDQCAGDLDQPGQPLSGRRLRQQYREQGRDLERRAAVDHARPAGAGARQLRLLSPAHLRRAGRRKFLTRQSAEWG